MEKGKIIKVDSEYRTNQLSLKPGGTIIIVEYLDGRIMKYDNVKNAGAYIRKVLTNPEVKSAYSVTQDTQTEL